MNFAENLRELAEKTELQAESDRKLSLEKSAEKYADETVALIRDACLKLAETGQRQISGYLSKKWLGYRCVTSVIDYPDGEVFYKPHGRSEYYTMESFGKDGSYAETVCEKISSALRSLGFGGFTVEPELRKFIKREKYRRLFSKKPRYKVVQEKERYVIYLDINW